MILKNGINKSFNPYNRNSISREILNNIRQIIRISNILKIPINITLEKVKLTPEKKYEHRITEICQKMDELGNYTNVTWFLNLKKNQICKFLYELHDIWQYRAQLSTEIKIGICPPNGNPFMNLNINNLGNLDFKILKNVYLNVIETLINSSTSRDSKTLGAYYVLSALTLVSIETANALPWLYESVAAQ